MAVQSQSSTPSGVTTTDLAFSSDNSGGNLLIAYVFGSPVTTSGTGVRDSLGNSWIRIVDITATPLSETGELWYARNCLAGPNTVTFNWSSLVSFSSCTIAEYSGYDTAAPFDQYSTNEQQNVSTAADAITTGAVSTTTDGQLILAGTGRYGGTGVATTVGTGYTLVEDPFGDTPLEEKVQTSAGTVAGTFTSDDASNDYLSILATFKSSTTSFRSAYAMGANVILGAGNR